MFEPEDRTFAVYASPVATSYKVTIDKGFTSVQQFEDLVDVLDNASPEDCVTIRLSTDGGALHSIIPVINALQNTDAYVHCHVESDTASAGTAFMMLAHSCFVNDFSTVMLHTANYGFFGHAGNMEANVSHSTKSIEKFVGALYTDWLTEAELLRLLDGKEMYFDAEECHKRFKARDAIREERCKDIQQELEKKMSSNISTD